MPLALGLGPAVSRLTELAVRVPPELASSNILEILEAKITHG